ncbi:MAG: Ig-like domain-containing protein, partial [Pseudomonadota bacterium]
VDDAIAFTENEPLTDITATVLANDIDPDAGDVLEIVSIDASGVLGLLSLDMSGNLTYDPNGQFDSLEAGQTATETFTYTVEDLAGETSTATVEITISGNGAPTAVDDARTIGEADGSNSFNQPSGFSVLNNDSDPENDDLTIVGFDDSSTAGTVTLVGQDLRYDDAGRFDFLNDGETAQDTFTYTIEDEAGNQSTATVTVTIQGSTANSGDELSFSGEQQARIVDLSNDSWSNVARVLPIGDSITLGVQELSTTGANPNNPAAADLVGYRQELFQDLGSAGAFIDYVGEFNNGSDVFFDGDHDGTGGRFADDVLAEISTKLSDEDPDVILLMIGTNDIDAENNAEDTVPVQIGQIIDIITAQAPNVEIFIAEIPPIAENLGSRDGAGSNDPGDNFNDRIDELNANVESVVNAKAAGGANVTFVDTNLTDADMTGDSPADDNDNGLHPNAQGYSKIADAWLNAINSNGNLSITNGTINGEGFDASDFSDVVGSEGNDIIIGDSQVNDLEGGGGRDEISGGGGGDILDGGAGDDTLTGDGGADTFEFSTGDDVITDFVADTDEIDFTGTDVVDFATFQGRASDVSGDVVYDDGVNTLTIEGVTLASLDADDFIFA